jgi:hypothetical protein
MLRRISIIRMAAQPVSGAQARRAPFGVVDLGLTA